jgi:tetratricopeptide (TPR) repeat protein
MKMCTTPAACRTRLYIIAGTTALAIIVFVSVILAGCTTTHPPAHATTSPQVRQEIDTAWALNAQGKFADAANAADGVISSDPVHPDGWALKGWALTGLGRHADALVALDKALVLDSNNAITWSNKGFALMNLGRCPEAVTAFDRAIALDPFDYGAKKYRTMAAHQCPVKP